MLERQLLVAAVLIGAGGSALATGFEASVINGQVTGTLGADLVSGALRPARYGMTDGARALTVRLDLPVICARKGAAMVSGKRVVIDPNGYVQDTSMLYVPPTEAPTEAMSSMVGWVRASDSAPFARASFVAGGQAPLVFVEGVDARCVALPASDTTVGPASCTGAVDAPESIFGGQFEAPSGDGTLTLSSRIVSSTVAWVTYEHVLSAGQGPIGDLSLREQFAHATLATGQPIFQNSLGLTSGWSCQASEGANCGAGEREGLGYIKLDSVGLQAGSCLRITATRPRRSDGLSDVPFSGRVFTAAFYKRSSGLQYVDGTPATTRINYVQ